MLTPSRAQLRLWKARKNTQRDKTDKDSYETDQESCEGDVNDGSQEKRQEEKGVFPTSWTPYKTAKTMNLIFDFIECFTTTFLRAHS